jgi:hypothetical protein
MELAFDHALILSTALQRLRSKVEYSTLPVYFLPEAFTLTELQRVYEAILGGPVDKSAFRKKIRESDSLEELTGQWRLGSNRPAQLYRVRAPNTTVYFQRGMAARQA